MLTLEKCQKIVATLVSSLNGCGLKDVVLLNGKIGGNMWQKIKCCDIQTYGCQELLSNNVCVDKCLSPEIKFLWGKGIKTLGCCCGHHTNSPKNSGYIQVEDKYVQQMKDMGYKYSVNEFGKIIFKPKTKFIYSPYGLVSEWSDDNE